MRTQPTSPTATTPDRRREELDDKLIIHNCEKIGEDIGFYFGSSVTIVGIPLALTMEGLNRGVIPQEKGERAAKILAIIGFPGTILGLIGMGIGSVVGKIVGHAKVKMARKKD